ncbi:MAG: hypothetical protein ACJAXY_000184 [Nonlabens sp.]|jgi:hypothetical protein
MIVAKTTDYFDGAYKEKASIKTDRHLKKNQVIASS